MAAASRAVGRTAVAVLVLAASVALAACSSDGSDGADAPRRTTTTAADGPSRTTTSTTEAERATTTTAAPSTTATPATGGGGGSGSSTFRGDVDGQKGVAVTFTRSASAITDVRAEGLELTCQPLKGGDAKTITVDVAMAQVPLSSGLIEHTEAGAPYEPTLSGSFTPAGAFAGALSLSGQRDGYACGGEFTFLATPT